jgi:hypothetical protein
VNVGRKHYVLDSLRLYLSPNQYELEAEREALIHGTGPQDEPAPEAGHRIDLEEEESRGGTVPQRDQSQGGTIIDEEPYLELEHLNRVLYAVKLDKSEANKAFGERIKELEEKIQAQLRYIARAKDQYALPFDEAEPEGPPQEEAENGPEIVPGDEVVEDTPEPPGDSTDGEEEAPEPEIMAPAELLKPGPPPTEKPKVCHACDGTGFEADNIICHVCNGEGVKPATRGGGTVALKCYACGQTRPAWSFANFQLEDSGAPPLKGHICSACRSNKRPARLALQEE